MSDPEWMDRLKAFCALVESEDYGTALSHSKSLLEDRPHAAASAANDNNNDVEAVRRAVLHAHIRCLLETEDFVKLREIIEQHQLQTELETTYQYTLYRLKEYQAMEDLPSDTLLEKASSLQKHLTAQKFHHLNKVDEALKLYLDLIRKCNDPEELEQLVVNAAALLVNQSVPYVRTPHSLEDTIQNIVNDAGKCPVDLVYNYGMLLAIQGERCGRTILQSATADAPTSPERSDLTQLLDWSVLCMSGTPNPSLCFPSTPTEKHSVWQSRLVSYNAAVDLLRQRKFAECHKAAKDLLASSSSSSRMSGATTHPHLPHNNLWWISRVAVLHAHCDRSKANEVLRGALERVKAFDSGSEDASSIAVRDAAWLYLESHRATLAGESLEVSRLPPSLQSSPGVVATRIRQGDESVEFSTAQQADHHLNSKEYTEAAALYRQLLEESHDPVWKARLVTALSHTDPEAAMELWSEASLHVATSDGMNGATLEQQELPRLKTLSRPNPEGSHNKPPKKSREQVLRRRAKQRDAHLSQLEAKGVYRRDRPTQPDPERWLPRVERSYGRKKRGGPKTHKGAQGGVSEKDAARLDVAARQTEGASYSHSGAPSTAHISATSGSTAGGRKAGRRK